MSWCFQRNCAFSFSFHSLHCFVIMVLSLVAKAHGDPMAVSL